MEDKWTKKWRNNGRIMKGKKERDKEAYGDGGMEVIHATCGRKLQDKWGSESPLATISSNIRLKWILGTLRISLKQGFFYYSFNMYYKRQYTLFIAFGALVSKRGREWVAHDKRLLESRFSQKVSHTWRSFLETR